MNYEEALSFIREADWKGSVPGLERISELLGRLGNPERQLKFIHVTGTNGKGSVCAMLSSILKAAGYKTGLCISPHLERYNERMQIDGCEISDEELCEVAQIVKTAMEGMEDIPTEFERVLAMCFVYYLRNGCDVVVLEVGLGGRLDATNVIGPPVLSVITSISLDHMEYLGNSLEEIAREKAGIIKTGSKALLYDCKNEAVPVIERICEERKVPLKICDFSGQKTISRNLVSQVFDYGDRKALEISLAGTYQLDNASLAIEAVDLISGEFDISEKALRKGLLDARWPGRFEVISCDPLLIADGAHNQDGVCRLAESIKTYLPGRRFIFIMSVMRDKDFSFMIRKMAEFEGRFIAVAPDYDRALPPKELAAAIERETGKKALAFDRIAEGVDMAFELCLEDEVIIAFGSLYQFGELCEAVEPEEPF